LGMRSATEKIPLISDLMLGGTFSLKRIDDLFGFGVYIRRTCSDGPSPSRIMVLHDVVGT
jgi:hypothetical protein